MNNGRVAYSGIRVCGGISSRRVGLQNRKTSTHLMLLSLSLEEHNGHCSRRSAGDLVDDHKWVLGDFPSLLLLSS